MEPEQRELPEEEEDVQVHSSRAVRLLYMGLGVVCVAVGALGAVLPLLPTTVFILLAAFFFARSSRRFYAALLNNRHFGPLIRNWRRHRCISKKSKMWALGTVAVTFAVSVGFFVEGTVLRVLLAAFGTGLSVYLYRLPTCDADDMQGMK